MKKLLFAPTAWFEDTRPSRRPPRAAALRRRRAADPATGSDTDFQDTVAAQAVRTPSGRFGYLRLWSFDVTDDVAYVEEVARLLGLLPQRGLIIDLRANPGASSGPRSACSSSSRRRRSCPPGSPWWPPR